jgi:hypothetical protein
MLKERTENAQNTFELLVSSNDPPDKPPHPA